jgi:hypothetical protein
MTVRKLLVALLSAPIMAVAPACGTHTTQMTPPIPTLPPRPVELRIDSITDPCALLNAAQLTQLNVTEGSTDQGAYQSGFNTGPSCGWPGVALRPSITYGVMLVLNRGAAAAQGTEPTRDVGGFAGVLTAAPGSDPSYHCGVMIDVAPDQTLMAGFDNPTKDFPGMNRQLACDRAQQLADMLLTNLRTRLGR